MSSRIIYIYLFLATLMGSLSIFSGLKWAVPFVQATLIFPLYLYHVINRESGRAVLHMILWAVLSSAIVVTITILRPELAEKAILRSTGYRDEMFLWIGTGIGPEGTPSQFIPQHILHYVVFLGVSLITLGWGGLVMGAILLNYMNYYVGALVLEAGHPTMAALLGWPPYAAIRVIAYICGAIAVSDLMISMILRR
ncbi:MAG: hypothetical protein KJ831_02380, partial [Candidatus Eisenbacteria bacterium]|nr:hypothetical protein [Candidatus Eisenbacteria bacterium]